MDREALAQAVGEVMRREDRVTKWLGFQVEELRAGYARLSMTVSEQMANGQAYCHGGMIFTLADSSFGFASNSHNQRSLAAACSIEFLAPARVGDRLTSECTEQARAGRSGVYDARVTNQEGSLIALFRGKSATVRGHWVEEGLKA
ncbi:MAG TPA: hydroxyphenylacetyl-CoA thioesterase PaaI [Burkholderiales bacterium]|nr:hydroxyphenylacetyl-CoA thioesterase PaaI [Burkholderiales bacterium]